MSRSGKTPAVTSFVDVIAPPCRWVFSEEALVDAVREGRPVTRTRKGTALRSALKAAGVMKLGLALATLVSGLVAVRLIARQAVRSLWHATSPPTKPVRVFVGGDVRAESVLADEYAASAGPAVVRLRGADLVATGPLPNPSVAQFARSWRQSLGELSRALVGIPREHTHAALDFLTSATLRLTGYAYARAFWRNAVQHGYVAEACFVTADTHAFAAVAEGIHGIYRQHGLLSGSLIFPRFAELHLVTDFDAGHVRKTLPEARLRVLRQMMPAVAPETEARVLVAAEPRTGPGLDLILPLLQFFESAGAAIHIRPVTEEVLIPFLEANAQGLRIQSEGTAGSFEGVIDRVRPRFVAGWVSTALADALYLGIIPVTVAADWDPGLKRTVFPFVRCCLRWPDDEAVIRRSLEQPTFYAATLQRLQESGRVHSPS